MIFGPVSIDLSIDYMLLTLVKYEGYGYSAPKIDDGFNAGAGAYIGLKLINSKVFDLTLPLGALFRISKLEVTHDGKKTFSYMYLNAESGLTASFRINKAFYLTVPFYIGYPVWKYQDVTGNTNQDFDVMNFSIGFCMRIPYGNKS